MLVVLFCLWSGVVSCLIRLFGGRFGLLVVILGGVICFCFVVLLFVGLQRLAA